MFKLPKEVKNQISSAPSKITLEELLVRDCAKVCRDNADRAEKAGARAIAQAHRVDAVDIETRYGLEPENHHE